ncbi:iron complex outermembrane recepter protein [Filimonas lacunae]|uniref:Iron complex outermembrane recepter protein n=1 Tax=Filimonas lacunae TaxID=477680 RepID=A0A173MHL3_9BACT|nr:TonB-dependent receptor [Filimonas lacunae]BAV06911.1 ferrichrome-iron receptor [Filimonas lacunae]SIS97973.1 iron complex outermembrane recepter protein [Filimonas lacunae]
MQNLLAYYRHFLLVFTLFLCSTISLARDNDHRPAVKGSVVTSDGKPVDGASVRLKGTHAEAITEEDGTFTLWDVHPGQYELEVLYLGYAPVTEHIEVHPHHVAAVTVKLSVTQQQLTEVTITTGFNRFNKKETDDVARLPLKNMENPQVYTVVTKELMKEQLITDYNSAFKNIPGAGVPVVYNQGRSAMLSRGFTTANLIRNSISGFVYTNIDPANLEALEAIKGPSGTLFNSSQISFGGLFNRVTKKPNENRKTEISYSGGSYNLNRLTWDINTPIKSDNSVLMRINGALHTEQSFQDYGFTRSAMIAPSFIYKANDKLSFLIDMEASMYNATSPIRLAPYASGKATNIKDMGIDYFKSFTNNSLDYKTQQLNFYGQINYQLNSNWKLQTFFTRTYSATKGYVSSLTAVTDSTLRPTFQRENFPYNGTELQQNIVGDFHIAGIRNRMVAGIDFYNQRSDRNTPTIVLPTINYQHVKPSEYYFLNVDKVDSIAARLPIRSFSNYRTNQYTYSAYVSDVVNITDQLSAMLSLRVDHFEDKGNYAPYYDTSTLAYQQNALSPKLGLVYQVVKDQVSLFGNYMNGFNNQGGTDFSGNSFKPQHANQWEAGIKLDAFHHRLSSTISYYHIKVENTLRDDPDHANFSLQDGTQLSKGVEAEVIANPFGGLNIVAGYTYNDNKYIQAKANMIGLRPAEAGPQHLANLWMSYHIMNGGAKGLGFGVGGNYGSSAFQTNTSTFTFTIPSYKVLDATVYYDRPTFRVGVKVDNIMNERYWSFRLAPQMPTRVTANITLRF